MQDSTPKSVYSVGTLKDLSCSSTISGEVHSRLKDLNILKPFRGCRSGKAVKEKFGVNDLNIQTQSQRSELKFHASKNTRRRSPVNQVNIEKNNSGQTKRLVSTRNASGKTTSLWTGKPENRPSGHSHESQNSFQRQPIITNQSISREARLTEMSSRITRSPFVMDNPRVTSEKPVTRGNDSNPPTSQSTEQRATDGLEWDYVQPRHPVVNLRTMTKLASFNVRTLSSAWRRGELTAEADKLGFAAIGIQEHRMRCDQIKHLDMGKGWKFVYTSADDAGVGGVGILLSPASYGALQKVEHVSDRVITCHFTCTAKNKSSFPKIVLISCYSPTSLADEPDIEKFYTDLQKAVNDAGLHAFVSVFGDFNARLQHSTSSPWVYSDVTNRNTDFFEDFLRSNSLYSANTTFQKKRGRLYTHKGPQGYLSQIDHILFRLKHRNSVRNCTAVTFRPFESDHRLMSATVRLSLRAKPTVRSTIPRYDWSTLREEATATAFRLACTNRYNTLSAPEREMVTDHRLKYAAFVSAIQEAAAETVPKITPRKKHVPWEDERVIQARDALGDAKKRNRLNKSDVAQETVANASLELAQVYAANQVEYIEKQVTEITSTDGNRRLTVAWKVVNNLSGRKSKPSVKIKAENPKERISGWKNHFEKLLNNPLTGVDEEFILEKLVSEPLDIPTGEITWDELTNAARQMKNGKACGVDLVPSEVFKDDVILKLLHPILNEVLTTKSPPVEFLKNKLITLPKKGDLSIYDNYRGITLMSCTAKLYNRVILNRIRDPVEKLLRPNQNGFRPSRSTLEPVLALRRLIEEISAKKDLAMCSVFVDFQKAFDSVSRERLFLILSAYGIPDSIIDAIKCLYDGSTSFVSTAEGDSEPFLVTTGVLQGDTLAPFLFIITLDYVLRKSMDSTLGLQTKRRQSRRHPAKTLTDLDFADDLALLADTIANAQKLLSNLETAAAEVGLLINQKKTKYMCIGAIATPGISVRIGKGEIDQVSDFCYLGSYVRTSERDMKVRKALAWTAADKMWRIWKSPMIPRELKIYLFKSTVESILLYGSPCWSLTVKQTKSLDGTYTRLLRKVTDTHYSEHVTNEILYGSLPRVSDVLLERRLRFAGHCVRRKDQPVSDLVLWQPVGTFVRGGHVRMTFPRRLLRDTGMDNVTELHRSMLDRDDWKLRIRAAAGIA